MRATRSTWFAWLQAQRLPVPVELRNSIFTEGEIVEPLTQHGAPPALSEPVPEGSPAEPEPPMTKEEAVRLARRENWGG
jgi:hypothetical protein